MVREWLVMAKLAYLLFLCGALGAAETLPIKTLIFSGHNNHDWRSTTPFLKKILLESGRFDVRVEEEPRGTTAATLAGYDLLVLDYQGPRWGAETEKAVDAFVRSGKGLVGVHAAGYAFAGLEVLGDRHVRTGLVEPAWPEFFAMLGGRWQTGPPKTGHGQRHSFRVRFTDSSHPIASGSRRGLHRHRRALPQYADAPGGKSAGRGV